MNTNLECVKCAYLSQTYHLCDFNPQRVYETRFPIPRRPRGTANAKKNGGRLVILAAMKLLRNRFSANERHVSIRNMMRYVPFSLIVSMTTPECWPQNLLAWHRLHVSRVFQTLLYITSLPQNQGLGEELEHLSSQRMAPQIANRESWHPKILLIVSWLLADCKTVTKCKNSKWQKHSNTFQPLTPSYSANMWKSEEWNFKFLVLDVLGASEETKAARWGHSRVDGNPDLPFLYNSFGDLG